MKSSAIRIVILAVLFLLTVFQFLSIPGQFRYLAEQEPENAHLRWPLTALGFTAILLLQITLVSLWILINEVRSQDPFSIRALRRIKTMKMSLSGFLAILGMALAFVLSRADDPGLLMVLMLISGVVILLVLVIWEIERLFVRVMAR